MRKKLKPFLIKKRERKKKGQIFKLRSYLILNNKYEKVKIKIKINLKFINSFILTFIYK